MKRGLKFCVAALAFALICMGGLILYSSSAEAEIVASGACGAEGDNLTWTLDDLGVLTISGTGHMDDYIASDAPPLTEGESLGSPAPWGTGIERVILENGVASIGMCAFYDCGALTSVTIPDSVTSIKVQAFAGCGGLASVTLPNSVTSIYSYAFAGCEGLTSVRIPAGTEFIDCGAFCYCTNLSSVTILNPDAVIGDEDCDVFVECAAGMTLHGWAGSTAQTYADSAGHAFAPLTACGDNLTFTLTDDGELTIFGTGDMYDYEYYVINGSVTGSKPTPWGIALTKVTVEEGVSSIGKYAFYSCENLTSVSLPDGFTRIGQSAFSWCTGLPGIEIPDSVTTIAEKAFYKCSSLTGIAIPDGVAGIGKCTFDECENLTSVAIPDSVTSIGEGAFYGCTSLTGVAIPDSVASIGNYAFEGCTSLTSIAIPDGVASIEARLFYGCTSLTGVTIPSSVTSIDYFAFKNCQSLTGLTIPYGVTSISPDAFENCTSLTSVTIPSSVASIGYGAFLGCTSLTSATVLNPSAAIGDKNNRNVFYSTADSFILRGWPGSTAKTYAGKAGHTFEPLGDREGECGENVTWTFDPITATLTITGTGPMEDYSTDDPGWYGYRDAIYSASIGDGVTSVGEAAFLGCVGLADIAIPDGVTGIGSYAFQDCAALTDIAIPDSVTGIGRGAFYQCAGLTGIAIPDNVTGIGDYTFFDCVGLAYVTIPDGVTGIGLSAFNGCAGLTSVTIPPSVASIGSYAFYGCTGLTDATVLNPGAVIGDDRYNVFGRDASLTLRGWPDSTAQAYARAAGHGYEAMPLLALPSALTSIEEDAFQGVSALGARIPAGVGYISGDPFAGSDVRYILGVPGTAAQTFAANYGYIFLPVNDLVAE